MKKNTKRFAVVRTVLDGVKIYAKSKKISIREACAIAQKARIDSEKAEKDFAEKESRQAQLLVDQTHEKSKYPKSSTVMWAIYNPKYGIYSGTARTRRSMVYQYCALRCCYSSDTDIKNMWKRFRKKGDQAVKVMVRLLDIDNVNQNRNGAASDWIREVAQAMKKIKNVRSKD